MVTPGVEAEKGVPEETLTKRYRRAEEKRLNWKPGLPDYSRKEVILAIMAQSDKRKIGFEEVLEGLGPPDRMSGNIDAGKVLYFYSPQNSAVIFNIQDSLIASHGWREKYGRVSDSPEYKNIPFDTIISEMQPFDKAFINTNHS